MEEYFLTSLFDMFLDFPLITSNATGTDILMSFTYISIKRVALGATVSLLKRTINPLISLEIEKFLPQYLSNIFDRN